MRHQSVVNFLKEVLSKSFNKRSISSTFVPTLSFLLMALLLLGFLATSSSSNMLLQPPNRDLWQHAAALRTLIDDLVNPENPFVASNEAARHFSPWWVAWAWLAQSGDLSEWDVLRISAYVTLTVLASGIFIFARTFYHSSWAPLFLLTTMLLGWFVPIEHTGFHSSGTLLYGAAYPATLLIGLSLLLWAITIRSLHNSIVAALLVPTAAFMFATHQLGAVIGLIGASCFALFWPDSFYKNRAIAILGLAGGLALSAAWPYYNPLTLIFMSGNSTWNDGPDFYGPVFVLSALIPSIVGLLGFRGPTSRAITAALVLYICLYLIGLTGMQLAGRFLMPITLVLHIGLTSFLLKILFEEDDIEGRKMLAIVATSFAAILLQVLLWIQFERISLQSKSLSDSYYAAANALTRDIPDSQEVAVLDVAAWPIVAVGQKVLSIPWPEPLIHDLAERQAATRLLFSDKLSKEERLQIARDAGVNSLIVEKRYLGPKTLEALSEQSESMSAAGPLLRFDLVLPSSQRRLAR